MKFFLFFMLFLSVLFGSALSAEADDVIVLASWYGGSHVLEGSPMANGRPFKSNDKTIAAHRSLPFGTELIVTNPDNGRKLKVKVQDRGPFTEGRELDLSQAAASELGYVDDGLAALAVTIVPKKHTK